MEYKAQLMDAAQIHRTMARLTHEIIEKNHGTEKLCLLGIKRRGVPLAHMLKENLLRFEQVDVPVGHIDISPFRDDREDAVPPETAADCHIPCKLEETTVILVDDVLHTGRTVRAAIEAIPFFMFSSCGYWLTFWIYPISAGYANLTSKVPFGIFWF